MLPTLLLALSCRVTFVSYRHMGTEYITCLSTIIRHWAKTNSCQIWEVLNPSVRSSPKEKHKYRVRLCTYIVL